MTIRSFYFDDGKSRKRWRVDVSGNSLTVGFGRLTGKLREMKKVVKSTAEAKKVAAQLSLEKLREGYIEVDPKRLEVNRVKGFRAATEKQVAALELAVGSSLPHDYRQFLLNSNGGSPNPDCVRVPGVAGIDNVGVGSLFHLQPCKPKTDEITFALERTKKLLPKGHLPIAGSSDLFTISLAPKSFGAVYWWFHETDDLDDEGNFLPSAAYLLASSFDEFLTRIACLNDDHGPDTDVTNVNRPSVSKSSLRALLSTIKKHHTPPTLKEIKRLIKASGDLSSMEDRKWPFINLADVEILQLLLKAGLNPEILDTEGHTLLWQCASSAECVELLAKQGVDINRRSGSDGETPLMRAIYLKCPDAIERLVQFGANPTLRLDPFLASQLKRDTRLHKLVEKLKADWLKKQAKASAAPPAVTAKPSTPASKGLKPSIKNLLRLLQHDWITEGEVIEGVPEMIAALGDLSEITHGQWPTIDKFEDPPLLGKLLQAGLNPNVVDKKGNPLLHQCASHPACLSQLLKAGANVDQRNRRGETALMRATWVGDQECVQVLLDGGADPTIEFPGHARIMLEFDEEMTAFIEQSRKRWSAKKGRKVQVQRKR